MIHFGSSYKPKAHCLLHSGIRLRDVEGAREQVLQGLLKEEGVLGERADRLGHRQLKESTLRFKPCGKHVCAGVEKNRGKGILW
jgi:hypothetical protein